MKKAFSLFCARGWLAGFTQVWFGFDFCLFALSLKAKLVFGTNNMEVRGTELEMNL